MRIDYMSCFFRVAYDPFSILCRALFISIVNISFCLIFKINSVLSSLYISNNKYDLLIVGMG
ncbi:hypothetical protein [Ehrlichia ruminantium]|uniref:hypothetical protein n=1 Tax=Ehrlichia ruminantium TaxID=779 RepID=UPI0012FF12F2|nr:hypothetical protein [Ehrlichia ruminantium]QLK54714.1 hypothetical protein FDZ62_00250 [Ehrlichia ruminantium]QLK55633.1 hypothetical protein FDZ61_00250 [Ehrlichia ruminantium]UOD99734.1 hypothetical protein IMW62_00245 [Ehrlichia ruminantium]